MPRVTAAVLSIASGPPTSTGAPIGTAIQADVGRLTGKLQLDTSDVSRPAEEPPMLTVLLPVTIVPRLSGKSFGANAVPGGVGTCWIPRTSVPVLAAGMPLISTAPPPPPKRASAAALIAAPSGSKTTPTNGCGSGVGTGPRREGTITTCVSTPITRSPNFAALKLMAESFRFAGVSIQEDGAYASFRVVERQ
jgi:hypothetical protein